MIKILLSTVLALSCLQANAAVQLAAIFSDNMVLQRDKPINVWGSAAPGESVSVQLLGESAATKANSSGYWQVSFAAKSARTQAFKLIVTASNTVTLDNLLIGDVWLAGGQSNMKWTLGKVDDFKALSEKANNSLIRVFNIPQTIAKQPKTTLNTKWQESSSANIKNFSAIAAIFAQDIQAELQVPVGVVSASVGSTGVSSWVTNEYLQQAPFAETVQNWLNAEKNWSTQQANYLTKAQARHKRKIKMLLAKGVKVSKKKQQLPSQVMHISESRLYPAGAFNGMIMPIKGLSLKGVIWAQGEANMDRGLQYQTLLPEMIGLWRELFNDPKLPFLQVMLPELKKQQAKPGESLIAELRQAQINVAKADEQVYVVNILDTQKKGNIHPTNKQLPGKRLAKLALAKVYEQDIQYSSPEFSHLKIDGDKVLVAFKRVSGSLIVAKKKSSHSIELVKVNEPVLGFAVAGSDLKFYWADAKLENNQLLLTSSQVAAPKYVRYGWADNPGKLNLYDASGGPVMPFKTDNIAWQSKDNKEYKIVLVN